MFSFISKRLLQLIPIILGVTFMTFTLLYLAPGDPAQSRLLAQGTVVSDEALESTRESMGLNEPFLVQYWNWLKGLLTSDFGTSYHDDQPVMIKLQRAAIPTIQLTFFSMLITLLISVPLGILMAIKQNKWIDNFIRLLTFIGTSIPNFMISLLLIYVVCLKLKLLPVVTSGTYKGLILPVITLVIMQSSKFIRQVRAEILEQMDKEYVLSARVRGVKESTLLFKNVLHNSMITIITIFGLSVGTLLAGTAVIETIFSWPGLGKLVIDSISYRDYPVIQGFVVIMATVYVLINLFTDICYKILDPRVG
ncbi:nickel ABC transporter permease [Anaeromicropila populeti]|uniref:Nickel import system permease protein NikB n=1 Tax=Anaeromicropila populeti TaxID=37658 RepID=A0A1I6IFT7_9FIRM|nr:nickel ABC transporter permease [Anaeromicropila populeti]SFR65568.1 peptide/nickel transport system permease protein [Anaeromicropila populeti]